MSSAESIQVVVLVAAGIHCPWSSELMIGSCVERDVLSRYIVFRFSS